jgi:cell division protein ZapA (FtsZ GTPase activity inhibitor)
MAEARVVNIHGRQYKLKADDESDIETLAEMVDHRMRELEAQSGSMHSVDLAILTALQLADELARAHAVETDEASVPEDIGNRIDDLVRLVESHRVVTDNG